MSVSVNMPSGQEIAVTSVYAPVASGSAIALNSRARGSRMRGSRCSPNCPLTLASCQSPDEPASKRPR